MSIDRRIHPRVLVDIETEIGVDASLHVQTMENLSLGGCFVRSESPEPLGSIVMVRFSLPGDPSARSVRAAGRVAWTKPDPVTGAPYGMGIQFLKVEDADLELLMSYITGYANS